MKLTGDTCCVLSMILNCTSDEYCSFVPFVLVVLIGFIVALPTVILVYLWVHRNDLYTARTHQRIGRLCKGWGGGAEGGIKLVQQTYVCVLCFFFLFLFDVLDEPFSLRL